MRTRYRFTVAAIIILNAILVTWTLHTIFYSSSDKIQVMFSSFLILGSIIFTVNYLSKMKKFFNEIEKKINN